MNTIITPANSQENDGSGIPVGLTDGPYFVVWRYERRKGELTKVPLDPETGGRASSTDSGTWGTYQQAREMHSQRQGNGGIGFVFNDQTPEAGIDIDDCRDPDTGVIAPWAMRIIEQIDSYTEVSPSKTGVKIFLRGDKPAGKSRVKIEDGEIEVYDRERFFTLTGEHVPSTPERVQSRSEQFAELYGEYFGNDNEAAHSGVQASGVSPFNDDHELIAEAERITGDKFRRLMSGDISGYPSPSEARAGLIGIVRWYASDDRDQIARIVRMSGLSKPKLDEPRDGGRVNLLEWEIERLTADPLPSYYTPNGESFISANHKNPPQINKKNEDEGIICANESSPYEQKQKAKEEIQFFTLAELEEIAGEDHDFIVTPYIARGGLTDLSGPAKKGGKTTMVLHMVKQVLEGGDFKGLPTQQAHVLFLTEQGSNFVHAARDAGLDPEHHGLRVLPWINTRGHKWGDIVSAVRQEALKFGAGFIIVDTLNRFSGLKGEEENHAGHVSDVMNPLMELAQGDNVAVLSIRHANKQGNGRGSTQFDHDVDQLLTIGRPHGNYDKNVRELTSVGRYDDSETLIELTESGYIDLGDDKAVKSKQAEEIILDMVSEDRNNPTPKKHIIECLEQDHGVSSATTRAVLQRLECQWDIEPRKLPQRGSPVVYHRIPPLEEIVFDGVTIWKADKAA